MIETRYKEGVEPHERISAYLFYPIGGEIEGDETEGSAMISVRNMPSDVWPVPHELAAHVRYGVWRRWADERGHTVCVFS